MMGILSLSEEFFDFLHRTFGKLCVVFKYLAELGPFDCLLLLVEFFVFEVIYLLHRLMLPLTLLILPISLPHHTMQQCPQRQCLINIRYITPRFIQILP